MIKLKVYYLCLLIFTLNLKLSSSVKKNNNLDLTPTVRVEASFDTCFKCSSDSFLNRITDSSPAVVSLLTCNGFLYHQKPHTFNIYYGGSQGSLVLSKMDIYSAFLNGNMMSITAGYTSNGTCAGDYVYIVTVGLADNQEGCSGKTGVSQHRLIWNMIQVIGKCNSVCNGKGVIKFNARINNKGMASTRTEV